MNVRPYNIGCLLDLSALLSSFSNDIFRCQEADKQHKEEMEALNNEKEDLWGKLQDMIKQESALQAKVCTFLHLRVSSSWLITTLLNVNVCACHHRSVRSPGYLQ